MRTVEVNGAIVQATRTIQTLWRTYREIKPEVLSGIVRRMNYGKAPHHARRYVEGYAQALKDSNDA